MCISLINNFDFSYLELQSHFNNFSSRSMSFHILKYLQSMILKVIILIVFVTHFK